MTPEQITIVFLAVVAAIAAVSLFFRGKDRLVKARRDIVALNSVLAEHGLTHTSKILECLSVGDYAGAAAEVKWLVRQAKDPKQMALLLDDVMQKALEKHLASAADRGALLKKIADWAAANPEAVKAAGLAIAALPK